MDKNRNPSESLRLKSVRPPATICELKNLAKARVTQIVMVTIAAFLLIWRESPTFAKDENPDVWGFETDDTDSYASDIALPMLSFILPGAGQWVRKQYVYAGAYSTIAVGGVLYARDAARDVPRKQLKKVDVTSNNISARKYLLGLQTTQTSGGISLYHTFRSAVWLRQKSGQYSFLREGDTPKDILLAPFDFHHLLKPSTWIPLTVGGLAMAYTDSAEKGSEEPFLTIFR